MVEKIAQQLEEVAKNLDLSIREPTDYSHERYVTVKPERLVETVKKLKADYGVNFLSTLPAFDADDGYHIMYPFSIDFGNVMNGGWGKLVLDVIVNKNDPAVDSLVSEIPGAILYEREVYDMLGVRFNGLPDHRRLLTPDFMPPDLFPLRKENDAREMHKIIEEAGKDYETPPIEEKHDYSIAVGPQHPTHKEAVRFIFHVKGETIEEVDLRLGFNHRGIEKAFEMRSWLQNLYLATRLCGICSLAHQLAYVEAVEKCARIFDEVPDRARYIRVLVAELERVQSHILWYGVLAHDTGYDTMFHLTWRDREIVNDILEMVSGNRVNYAMLTIGGARRDISPELKAKIIPMLKDLRKKCLYHRDVLNSERSFIVRQKDVAPLSREDALRFCAVGPTARASNVNIDLRKADPYAAYDQFSFDVPVYSECDILAAMWARLDETIISIDMCIDALENMPTGDIKVKAPMRIAPNDAIRRVEAPRGEDIHYVRSNGTNKPDRHKIRAPTLANFPSLVHRLKGTQVADIPPVIRVIDPCIGCCERVTFVDVKKNKSLELSGTQLTSRANRAYRLGTKVLDF
ncbi:MAG: NADH-quinone oxidoreductase subunit C [Promethearchaeota archaeon]